MPIGILSERDIVHQIAKNGASALDQPVTTCMTRSIKSCSREDTVNDIMGIMTAHRIRHMPVIDQGTVVGIISIGDVVKRKIEEAEYEAETLKAYIAT